MPAPIAVLLDALVAHLNGAPAQELLDGVTARRAYQQTQTAKGRETPAIFLSPDQWRPLGRCGSLRLDQHLINLTISRQDVAATNAGGDADQAIADTVRELLADFDHASGRVVDILGPLTVDREALQAPGLSSVPLLLDCEILHSVSEGSGTSEDTDEPGRLTVARAAVWNAVKNWPATAEYFARKYETDADLAELQLREPAAHELPAIAFYWGGISPEWKSSRLQEWPLSLRASLWLPGDRHTEAERRCEDVFDALYKACPPASTATYIQQATGFPPRRVGEMTVNAVTLGRAQQLRALRVDVAFVLRSIKDPFGEE